MEFNDSLFDNERVMSLEVQRALNITESTAVLKDGHYEIVMPWRDTLHSLPNNRILAVHRLELLRRRLAKDPVLFQKYSAFIDKLLDKAYARKVPDQWRLPGSCRTIQSFIQRNPGKLEWCLTVKASTRACPLTV